MPLSRLQTDEETFDSRQVDAGVLMDSYAIANNPQRAFLKRSRAGHQLRQNRESNMCEKACLRGSAAKA